MVRWFEWKALFSILFFIANHGARDRGSLPDATTVRLRVGLAVLGFSLFLAVGARFLSTRSVSAVTKKTAATVAPESAPEQGRQSKAAYVSSLRTSDSKESLWSRRPPKDAARQARRKELLRRYGRFGISGPLVDRMVNGDVVGALDDLKRQATAGDPVAINAYGNFVYWNCYLGRSPEQLDSFAKTQMQQSHALLPQDADWFNEALMDDVAFGKTIASACTEIVDVDQAFDMVTERAKQGDSASLWLASMTVGNIVQSQQLLRAAASAGSPDAQFDIAFTVMGGHQPELLGAGPSAMDFSELLRESALQIPQAEGNLAICEFYGCPGIAADPTEGVYTALDAAQHGFFDALQAIGPHLTPSQLDPNDVEAWRLIQASVEMQCGSSWSDMKSMKTTLDALSSPSATDAARQRAEQLWAQYGQDLGC